LNSSDTGEKKWEYNETVHQLFIDFKKVYDSVRREVLYNIIIAGCEETESQLDYEMFHMRAKPHTHLFTFQKPTAKVSQ
jgi:hypothetical protein